tara:strand:+ start:211 stop:312 length:102 start_codon:yes stop_codon:yes gene_type:complete
MCQLMVNSQLEFMENYWITNPYGPADLVVFNRP